MGEMMEKAKAMKVDQGMAIAILLLAWFGWGVLIAGFMQKDEEAKKAGIIMGIACMFLPVCGWCLSLYLGWNIYQNSK